MAVGSLPDRSPPTRVSCREKHSASEEEDADRAEGWLGVERGGNFRTYAWKPAPTSMVTLAMPPGLFDRTNELKSVDDASCSILRTSCSTAFSSTAVGGSCRGTDRAGGEGTVGLVQQVAQHLPEKPVTVAQIPRQKKRESRPVRSVTPVPTQKVKKFRIIVVRKVADVRGSDHVLRQRSTTARAAAAVTDADLPCTASRKSEPLLDDVDSGGKIVGGSDEDAARRAAVPDGVRGVCVSSDVESSAALPYEIWGPAYQPRVVLERVDPLLRRPGTLPRESANDDDPTASDRNASLLWPEFENADEDPSGSEAYGCEFVSLGEQSGATSGGKLRSDAIDLEQTTDPKELLLPKVDGFDEFGEVEAPRLQEEEEEASCIKESASRLLKVARQFLNICRRARESSATVRVGTPSAISGDGRAIGSGKRTRVVTIRTRSGERPSVGRTAPERPIGSDGAGRRRAIRNRPCGIPFGIPASGYVEDLEKLVTTYGCAGSASPLAWLGSGRFSDPSEARPRSVPALKGTSATSGTSEVPASVGGPAGGTIGREPGQIAGTAERVRVKTEPIELEDEPQELPVGCGTDVRVDGSSESAMPHGEPGRAVTSELVRVRADPRDYTRTADVAFSSDGPASGGTVGPQKGRTGYVVLDFPGTPGRGSEAATGNS